MSEEISQNQMCEKEKDNVGCIGIGIAFLLPLPGVIMYFIQRKSVNNPSAYLYAALAGFIVGMAFYLIP